MDGIGKRERKGRKVQDKFRKRGYGMECLNAEGAEVYAVGAVLKGVPVWELWKKSHSSRGGVRL